MIGILASEFGRPTCCDYSGGFAGEPGKGGPTDSPTGYLAPCPMEIIDWNIEHEYRYVLIVGELADIRKYAYDHAPRPAPPARIASLKTGKAGITSTRPTRAGRSAAS